MYIIYVYTCTYMYIYTCTVLYIHYPFFTSPFYTYIHVHTCIYIHVQYYTYITLSLHHHFSVLTYMQLHCTHNRKIHLTFYLCNDFFLCSGVGTHSHGVPGLDQQCLQENIYIVQCYSIISCFFICSLFTYVFHSSYMYVYIIKPRCMRSEGLTQHTCTCICVSPRSLQHHSTFLKLFL